MAHGPRRRAYGDHGRSGASGTGQEIRQRRPGRRQSKPVVAGTFPPEEIVEARRFLESNQQVGKIVVTA
jgi:hypothetical protein